MNFPIKKHVLFHGSVSLPNGKCHGIPTCSPGCANVPQRLGLASFLPRGCAVYAREDPPSRHGSPCGPERRQHPGAQRYMEYSQTQWTTGNIPYTYANAESPTRGRTCGRSAFLLTLSSLRSLRNMTCIAICWMAHGSRSDFTLLKILSKLK